jgi:hypothetical protein
LPLIILSVGCGVVALVLLVRLLAVLACSRWSP